MVDPKLAHPDSADAIKLRGLKRYLNQDQNTKGIVNFLWMDWLSIPQDPGRRAEQEQAINSLPSYFTISCSTVILTPTLDLFYDSEQGYLSRGHCLMELATSRLPRVDVFDRWFVAGLGDSDKKAEWGCTNVFCMEEEVKEQAGSKSDMERFFRGREPS